MTGQALVTRFRADVEPAKAAITALAQTAGTQLLVVSTAAVTAAKNLESIGAAGRTTVGVLSTVLDLVTKYKLALGALAAGAATVGIINAILDDANKRIENLVKLAADAKQAGVGTSFFQAWTLQAKDLQTEVSTLAGMLERARAASTTRLGENGQASTSPLASRLGLQREAGNISAADVASVTGARTQEERIRAMLDLIGRLEQEGRRLAAFDLARTMFGEDFEQKLRSGVDMVGRMKQALDETRTAGGQRIISDEEVQRGEEIRQKIAATQTMLAEHLKPLHEDIARISLNVRENWAGVQDAIATVVAKAGDLYAWVRSIGDKMQDMFKAIGDTGVFKDAAEWLDKHGLIEDRVGVMRFDTRETGGGEQYGPDAPRLLSITRDKSKPLPKTGGRSSGGAASDQVETYLNSLQRQIATMQAEADAYGKSNLEKARAVDLARALEAARVRGTPLTEAERRKVEELASAEGRLRDQLEQLQRQTEQNRQLMQSLGDAGASAFEAMLQPGAKANEVLSNLARTLASQSLRSLLTGQGPLALLGTASKESNGIGGLFGALFSGLKFDGYSASTYSAAAAANVGSNLYGPGFASGTDYAPGGWSLVGENGPELLNVPRGAQIVPSGPTGRMLQGGGGVSIGGPTIINQISGSVDHQTLATLNAQLERRLNRYSRDLPQILTERRARAVR